MDTFNEIFPDGVPADVWTNFDAYADKYETLFKSAEFQAAFQMAWDRGIYTDPDVLSILHLLKTDPSAAINVFKAMLENVEEPPSLIFAARSAFSYQTDSGSAISAPLGSASEIKSVNFTDTLWNPEVTAKLGELQTKAMEVGSVVADYVTASGDFGIGTAIVATSGIAGAVGARYFKARKVDLGLWWKDLTGEKQDQVSEDKRWRNVAGVARKAAVLIDHVAERTGIARGQAHELREEVTFFAPFAGAAYCQVTAENKAKIDERLDNGLRLDIEIEQVGADINASVVRYVYRDGNDILTEGTSLLLSAPDDIKLLIEQYLRAKENRDFAERMLSKLENTDQAQPGLETAPA